MRTCYLAIDQGTTNTKALLVSPRGDVIARGSRPVPLALPAPGWFEHDAELLWASVVHAVADCLAAADAVEIAGIALSNQRESAVAWDRATGRPLSPVIGWQDNRTAEWCATLQPHAAVIRARTGLRLDPMFSAPKMAWLLNRLAPSAPDEVCVGTVDAYLVARLTGGQVAACEAGNASRTMLLNLTTLTWDGELCELFGLPQAVLPEIRGSAAGFGTTATGCGLPAGLRVLAVLGDSHAALYASGCRGAGTAKVTYGTGSSLMAPVADKGFRDPALTTTLAWWTNEPVFAAEANILATGAALDTAATMLGFDSVGDLTAAALLSDDNKTLFVPAFAGLGAPHWDRHAVGLIAGIDRDTRRCDLARAAFSGVAHQVADVIDAARAAGLSIEELRCDGAPSENGFLMGLQADLVGFSITPDDRADLSALGAAELAAWADGHPLWRVADRQPAIRPRIGEIERLRLRQMWSSAVSRARGVDVGNAREREERRR